MFQFALLWVVSDVSQAIPIFNLLGGRGGGGSQRPKCRYVAQTAYFPTYDTVYKQECSTHYENQCTTEVSISLSRPSTVIIVFQYETEYETRYEQQCTTEYETKVGHPSDFKNLMDSK